MNGRKSLFTGITKKPSVLTGEAVLATGAQAAITTHAKTSLQASIFHCRLLFA
jgi:hypothetical protein